MKRLLNLLAITCLISSASGIIVACDSHQRQPNPHDVAKVDAIYYKINNLKIGVDELSSGSKVFKNYKTKVLTQVKTKLTTSEQTMISFASGQSDLMVKVDGVKINIKITSKTYSKNAVITVKLGYDAQTIVDKLQNELVTVKQTTKTFTQSEPLSNYVSAVKTYLQNHTTWSSSAEKSSYNITFLNPQAMISWPTKSDYKTWAPLSYNFDLSVGSDQKSSALKIEFLYSVQKKVLDDPRNASKSDPIPIPVDPKTGKILPSQWSENQVVGQLNDDWDGIGGLVPALYSDVKYKHVTIIRGTPVLDEMYLPQLGFTQSNPRSFWIEGQ